MLLIPWQKLNILIASTKTFGNVQENLRYL